MNSPGFRVRIYGPLACFTRPEFSTERVSYEVITPSAARGILEAVLWKPAMRWHIHAIHVLRPIRWLAFRRNEVTGRASTRDALSASIGHSSPKMFFADDCRAQRNTLALRDVDYIVEASIGMTECAGFGDSWTKFAAMFQRRLGTGQHLFQPYLGCREFPAFVEPSREVEDTIKETRELGWMLYDLDYDRDRTPLFFQARLEDGVLRLPTLEVMRK